MYQDDDPSSLSSLWAYSPETGEYIYCDIVSMDSPVRDICLENGIIPSVEWSVHPDGGIASTATIAPGYAPEEVRYEILRRAGLNQHY